MFPTLEDGVVGMRDEVLEMGLLIRRRRNLMLPTVTCDQSHIMCDTRKNSGRTIGRAADIRCEHTGVQVQHFHSMDKLLQVLRSNWRER